MAQLIRWFEIPAKDLDRAINFYSKILRIKIEKMVFDGVTHGILIASPGSISGAIVPAPKDVPEHVGPVLYFHVADMSTALELIQKSGGEIIKPKTMMKQKTSEGKTIIGRTLIENQQGYFALFMDSEGNRMALYSNS